MVIRKTSPKFQIPIHSVKGVRRQDFIKTEFYHLANEIFVFRRILISRNTSNRVDLSVTFMFLINALISAMYVSGKDLRKRSEMWMLSFQDVTKYSMSLSGPAKHEDELLTIAHQQAPNSY